MYLQYVLLTTTDGSIISSYNIKDGITSLNQEENDNVERALTSSIQPQTSQVLIREEDHLISDQASQVITCRGETFNIVLIGDNFDEQIVKKLQKVLGNCTSAGENTTQELQDPAQLQYLQSQFISHFFHQFHEEVIKDYYIPYLSIVDQNKIDVTIDSEFWNFISYIDGSRSLADIADQLNTSWFDIRFVASKLFSLGYISFKVEILNSSIFIITSKGYNILADSQKASSELRNRWSRSVLPTLQLIDGERKYHDLLTELKKLDIDRYEVEETMKMMLYHGMIKSVSNHYRLAFLMQKLYVAFFEALEEKVGIKSQQIFEEIISHYPDIKVLLPNFDTKKFRIELLNDMIKDLESHQYREFLRYYIQPLEDILNEVVKITGLSFKKRLQRRIFDEILKVQDDIVQKYNIMDVLSFL